MAQRVFSLPLLFLTDNNGRLYHLFLFAFSPVYPSFFERLIDEVKLVVKILIAVLNVIRVIIERCFLRI